MEVQEYTAGYWKEKYEASETRRLELEALVIYYQEQFRLYKHRQYGASSEKTPVADQLCLFGEFVNEQSMTDTEENFEVITYKRRKNKRKRADSISRLPVESVNVYALPEDGLGCPQCGEKMHEMKVIVHKTVKIIPAKAVVIEDHQMVYSCRSCAVNEIVVPIVNAPMPAPVIKGSYASPSSAAYVLTQKYVYGLPLYRQEQMFMFLGFGLSRQTMTHWVIRCSQDWLIHIYNRLKVLLIIHEILHADESPLQVLHEPGRNPQTLSYMWLYRTSGDTDKPIVIFEYKQTRGGENAKAFLKDFTGFLHADGHHGYHVLPGNIIISGCWVHMRRMWEDAYKVIPVELRNGKTLTEQGLAYIGKFFALEKKFADLPADERFIARLEQSRPITDAFFEWVSSLNVLPKSALGAAVTYTLNQRPYLENLYLDGRLEASNNRAERSFKPYVIGRKNWLFSDTVKGAEANAICYSVLETAKENHLSPFDYLEYLFTKLPNCDLDYIDDLLPWSDTLPDNCLAPDHPVKLARLEAARLAADSMLSDSNTQVTA